MGRYTPKQSTSSVDRDITDGTAGAMVTSGMKRMSPSESGNLPEGVSMFTDARSELDMHRTLIRVGPMKSGKSWWLCEMAAVAMKRRRHIFFLTMDMPVEEITGRVIAAYYGISSAEYSRRRAAGDLMIEMINKFQEEIGTDRVAENLGRFRIWQCPVMGITTSELEKVVHNTEESVRREIGRDDFSFDTVIIDSMNFIKDDEHSESHYGRIKNVTLALKRMEFENKWTMITAATSAQRPIISNNQ